MRTDFAARSLCVAAIVAAASFTLGCNDDTVGSPNLPDASESDTVADVYGENGENGEKSDTTADASTDTRSDCDVDPDDDGLTNCEEAILCGGSGSRPDKKDTDGDGLNDYEEVAQGTSPCEADTDGDGVDDKEELDFGFDPTDQDTYDTGKPDGEFWIFDACNQFGPKPIAIKSNQTGNWEIALDRSVEYTPLQLTGASSKVAAAALDHPEQPVAGFVKSHHARMQRDQFSEWFRQELTAPLSQMADQEILKGVTRGPGHGWGQQAEFHISLNQSTTAADVRETVFRKLSDLSASQINGYPTADDQTHTAFEIVIHAIHRGKSDDALSRPLITAAIHPDVSPVSNATRMLTEDWTGRHNLAPFGTSTSSICDRISTEYSLPRVDYLFVIDGDGDSEYKQTAREIARKIDEEMDHTNLDYRFGVTNMQPANAGRLRGGEWFADPDMLVDKLNNAALDCQSSDEWSCTDDNAHGLQVTRDGIEYMLGVDGHEPAERESIRPKASLLTLVMSDEDPASLSGSANISSYQSFFRGKTTLAAVTPGAECPNPDIGDAYEQIAQATGGPTADLCTKAPESIVQDIVFTAGAPPSGYNPFPVPISPSIAARADGGQKVPRSSSDGFGYFAVNNRVAFFGRFRPTAWLDNEEPGFAAFTYRHFTRGSSN